MIDDTNLRDTLNPNLLGWSANRRWRRVLFPTPDGPDSTRGRRISLDMVKMVRIIMDWVDEGGAESTKAVVVGLQTYFVVRLQPLVFL